MIGDASERLRQFGANEYAPPAPRRHLRNFARQFTHFLALLLWLAAGLAFKLDHIQPGQGLRALGTAIVAVIVINAVFAFAQEYKAERASMSDTPLWLVRRGNRAASFS